MLAISHLLMWSSPHLGLECCSLAQPDCKSLTSRYCSSISQFVTSIQSGYHHIKKACPCALPSFNHVNIFQEIRGWQLNRKGLVMERPKRPRYRVDLLDSPYEGPLVCLGGHTLAPVLINMYGELTTKGNEEEIHPGNAVPKIPGGSRLHLADRQLVHFSSGNSQFCLLQHADHI